MTPVCWPGLRPPSLLFSGHSRTRLQSHQQTKTAKVTYRDAWYGQERQAMEMLGTSLGSSLAHTSLSVGGLQDLGLDVPHPELHPHQPLPPHRPLSPPVTSLHSLAHSPHHHNSHSSTVDSSFSPGSTSSHLPSSTVKIKPGKSLRHYF